MLCVATVITWLWFCRAVGSHKVIHLSGLSGYWWYRGIIHIQSTEANTSFTQVDGWVSLLQVSPVRRQPDEVDGWRKASFFPWACEHIALHDPVNIHIPSLEENRGVLSITEKIRLEERKEKEKRIGPAHFSWHWLTCSYTIEQWCQAGKISPLLHGKSECQTSERECWRAGERGVKWTHL